MKRTIAILAATLLPTLASAGPIIVPAAGSVQDTVSRLEATVTNAGARVFTVVNFGAGAKTIGQDVGDIQLVVFGNPKIGTAALSADPMAALDLPAKVLVYATDTGTVMAYEEPTEMLAEWDIPANAPVLQAMAQTLDRITSMAAN